MRRFLVFLGLFIIAGALLAQPVTPHTIYGYVERSDGTFPPEACLHMQFDFDGHHFDMDSPEFIEYDESMGLFFLRITDDLFDVGDSIFISVIDSCLYEDQIFYYAFDSIPETDVGTITLDPIAGLRPILLGGSMTPVTGYVTTDYEYRVTYASTPWGRAAGVVQVLIDDVAFDMTRVSGATPIWATGEQFVATVDGHDIGKDDHSYWFYAEDNLGLPADTDPVDFTIMNTAPDAPAISLAPEYPFDDEDLEATIVTGSFDEDGDAIDYYYDWFKDGVLMPGLSGFFEDELDADNTSVGEVWEVRIYGHDGDEFSPFVSAEVEIIAPILSDGAVTPTTGDRATMFAYSVTYTNVRDIEAFEVNIIIDGGAPIVMTMARDWSDGVDFTYETMLDLGDHTFQFDAMDILGHEAIGDIDEHDGPSVGNNLPTITGATLDVDPAPATEVSLLTAVAAGWDDLDGDPEGYHYNWFVDDIMIGETGSTLDGDYFSRGDVVHCEIIPFDGIDEGTGIATAAVTIGNSIPTAPVAGYLPIPIYDNDEINITIITGSLDADDDMLTYHYEWSIDGSVVGGDESYLDAAETAPGDLVHVDVWANDGIDDGEIVGLDIPVDWPILSDGAVAPVSGAPTETFRYEVTYTSERDIEPGRIYAVIDGIDYAMEPDDPGDSDYTDGYDLYYETALPFGDHTYAFTGEDADGNEAFGEEDVRPGPVQENEIPVITDISIDPSPTATESDLIFVTVIATDADGDPVTLTYQWFNLDGAIVDATTPSLYGDDFDKGDVVWCEVLPNDGWEDGDAVLSDEVTIVNTPPTISSATVMSDPDGYFNELGELVANVVAGDIDGDPLTFEYTWFVNDVEIDPGPVTASRIDGSFFDRGDEVYFTVIVTDDDDEFATATAEAVTIGNAPPVFADVDIIPDGPTTRDDLDVTVDVDDADGDEIFISYAWSIDGMPILGAGDHIPYHMTEHYQVWHVVVTADDGMGGVTEAMDEVTILNTPPHVPAIVETIVVFGVPYYNTVMAFDPDPDRLIWHLIEGPENLILDTLTGDIEWTVFDEDDTIGVFPVIIEITDGDDVTTIEFNLHLYPIGNELFAPTGLEALSGYMLSIPTSWNAPALFGTSELLPLSFMNYEVQRSEDLMDWGSIGSPAGIGYVDASVAVSTTYYYRIRAIYDEGVSAWSNIDFATAGTINSNMLYSNYTYSAPPVIDGTIDEHEWSDATELAIGAQKFYVKNTENVLYMAFVDAVDTELDIDDAFYAQIEDSHNLRWPAASGSDEGEYRVTALLDGESEATYQGIWGTYPGSIGRDLRATSEAIGGAVGGGDGHAVVYEVAIEIGDEFMAQIDNEMGGVVGFRFAIYDAGTYSWTDVWTTGSINTDPEGFGNLMLGIGSGGPHFKVWPRSYNVTVLEGETATRPIWISNQGNGSIDYNIYETYLPIWEEGRSRDATHPVLLFTDEQTIGMDALDFLGYGYNVVHTSADFVSWLSIADYAAAVITVEDDISPAVLGVIETFIGAGGKVVLVCPDLDAQSGHTIWDAVGVEVFADIGTTPSALTWDSPEHPIFHTPFEVPLSVETVTGSFADYGDGILTVDATVVASFDELPYPGNGAIVLAADGAMFINSFVMNDDSDSDGDDVMDGMELLANEIYYVIGLDDIPWLSVDPEEGTLSSHRTDEGLVTFDATDLIEGDYTGYLIATSTDPGNPTIPVLCQFHVREPDYHLATLNFPPDLVMVRPGQTLFMPINVHGIHLAGVSEIELTVRTNEFVISPMDVTSDDYTIVVDEYNLDHITFTISHDWMMDDGLLCNVEFRVASMAPAGSASDLQITAVAYNDGAFIGETETIDGRVMVQAGENDWRTMLHFTHGVYSDDLYIGVNPAGSNVFDDGLDMLSDDAGSWFDPYSDIGGFDPTNPFLDGDIRSSVDSLITWEIPVGDSAGKLEWSFRDEDTLTLMGSLFINGRIDMKTSSVYFYEAGETIYITYRMAGETPFDVHLYPGWNMISLPITLPGVEPTVGNVYPDVDYAYEYDPASNMWVEADMIEPGIGYVVLSTSEQHYTLWGSPVDGFILNLITGWNLIGSVYGTADFSSPSTDPAGAVMAFPQHAAQWDVMLGEYQFTDIVEGGKGYFVAAGEDALLYVPGTGVDKALPASSGHSAVLDIEIDGETIELRIGEAANDWLVPIPPAVDGSVPVAYLKIDGWKAREVYFNAICGCELVVDRAAKVRIGGLSAGMSIGLEIDGKTVYLDGEVELPAAGSYKLVFSDLPLVFALGANIPNPFNPTTSISFDLSERCDVKLDVYNMLGKRVATLEDGEMSAGRYSVVWDGRDDSGRSVPTGIYLYRIEAGMDKASRRMILLK